MLTEMKVMTRAVQNIHLNKLCKDFILTDSCKKYSAIEWNWKTKINSKWNKLTIFTFYLTFDDHVFFKVFKNKTSPVIGKYCFVLRKYSLSHDTSGAYFSFSISSGDNWADSWVISCSGIGWTVIQYTANIFNYWESFIVSKHRFKFLVIHLVIVMLEDSFHFIQ